jgi:hypothetical protein
MNILTKKSLEKIANAPAPRVGGSMWPYAAIPLAAAGAYGAYQALKPEPTLWDQISEKAGPMVEGAMNLIPQFMGQMAQNQGMNFAMDPRTMQEGAQYGMQAQTQSPSLVDLATMYSQEEQAPMMPQQAQQMPAAQQPSQDAYNSYFAQQMPEEAYAYSPTFR